MFSSSSKTITAPAAHSTDEQPSFIDAKDKENEIQGTFIYDDKRIRIIRDLTEIHQVTWKKSNNKTAAVYVKYLRYATIIEGDIHLTNGDKKRELKRILDQMKLWTSLKHPNILPFLGYQWKETPILVFYWYKNGNVSQYLKTCPDADRTKLLAQVAQGLSFLHNKSIVHGDIKPNNVIIADDGHAMLMDFGMAPDLRMVERNMTMADSGRDNVGYMSPELIEEGNYTQATDVYAFGALVLEILSGHPPFYKLPYIQAMIQITKRDKPVPDDHPELSSSSPFWELMQRCWTTIPDDRPGIDEVRGALERMVKGKRSGLIGYFSYLCALPFRLVGLSW
ncbi:hypothetical protein FRC04_000712 [Tulasnella sp. 424]|nr:hypothetical protein FRC04_000712 [Tulasnella sp. 424]KAG8961199.1 hypothetical protein FRC05_006276 [Tulasnella sp. 425]